MSVDPEKLNDPKQIRNLLANAKKAGREDLVLQCQVRLAKLEGQKFSDPLEREFWQAVAAAEELATFRNGRTTRLSRTRQKEARVGVKKCLEDWALQDNVTQGFEILVKGGYPELTGEAIVVRHAPKFTDEIVQAAKKRLTTYGIDLSRIASNS